MLPRADQHRNINYRDLLVLLFLAFFNPTQVPLLILQIHGIIYYCNTYNNFLI